MADENGTRHPDQAPPTRPGRIAQALLSDSYWTTIWRLFSLALILIALAFLGYLFFRRGAPALDLRDGEFMRGLITILLLVVSLVLVVVLILTSLFANNDDSTFKRVNQGREVLTPLFGILGTIVGFYFGSVTRDKAAEPAASDEPTTVPAQVVSDDASPPLKWAGSTETLRVSTVPGKR
ncbi:MAG TPA: hypothetical protein VGR35_03215 [Tepidisphaeraceae bacterium]|nr:hypothetical protein [Tepidisphaeraceae bacterium]